jgi:predicted nucleotide-binding protein (sugar kinase/HSP70/actin superfamily)
MALDIDPSTVLGPVVHMKYDPDTLAIEIAGQIKSKLRVSKKAIKKALYYAIKKQDEFAEELYGKGRAMLEEHDPEEPLVVVTGRPYNLYDERLNLRLGGNLAKIGMAALPMDFIDVSSVDLSDFPSMYWGLGARILRTVKFIHANPNFFGLHLTNFACGADSFIEHFYKHIMNDSAYLILELDEHSAVAGVMTRIEAFKNVIENAMQKTRSGGFEVEDEMKLAN